MNRAGRKIHGESSSFYNEKEVRSINYESPSNFHSGNRQDGAPSKENVELSLEVEIADSLKKILTSPQNCTSRLLDVTIIRPKDSESSPQVETNTVAFDKNEIKDLISIIEKQKNEKKQRIEEQKKKLGQKIKGHEINYNSNYRPGSPQLKSRSEISRPKSTKTVRINHKPEFIEEPRKKDIGVRSAPPNITLEKARHNFDLKCLRGDLKEGKSKVDYAKKLQKYKDIEGRLLELCAASKSRYLNSKASISESAALSEKSNFYSQSTLTNIPERHTQQVYATSNRPTFDELRSKFKCTNQDKCGKPEGPCVCQHCGMVGVLTDSQKGPVLPATTKIASPWSPNQGEIKPTEKKSWKDNFLSMKNLGMGKNNFTNSHDCMLKQINIRLKSLEERVTIQEETAVTRDYFKVIMNKLLLSYKSIGSESGYKKETSIQVGKSVLEPTANNYNACTSNYIKGPNKQANFPFRRHRTDSVNRFKYDKKRINYMVNSALVQPDMSTETVGGESFFESEISCHTYSRPDFKIDKIDEVEESRTNDSERLKEKDTLGLWRWGEEIIKPGFDLKNKIMSLLEEKLQALGPKTMKRPTKIENDVSVQVELETKKASICEEKIGGVNLVPENKYFDQRGIMPTKIKHKEPIHDYPLDVRKALDDSTFRKNIEAHKRASHWKKYAAERFKRDKYDSGDTTSTFVHPKRLHKQHRPSVSDIDIRRMKKREVVRIEPKTFVAPPKNYGDCHLEENYKNGREYRMYHDKESYTLERKRSNLNSKTLQVSYLNPKASSWAQESHSSGSRSNRPNKKLRDKTGGKRRSKTNLNDKLHYLKELAKSRNVNEDIIWDSIIKQVKRYSNKQKGDTVKIQIPTEALYRIQSPDVGVTEIEMTIADLQNIIQKAKQKDEVSSIGSANTTNNFVDNRKKLQELHKQLGTMLNKKHTKFGL